MACLGVLSVVFSSLVMSTYWHGSILMGIGEPPPSVAVVLAGGPSFLTSDLLPESTINKFLRPVCIDGSFSVGETPVCGCYQHCVFLFQYDVFMR